MFEVRTESKPIDVEGIWVTYTDVDPDQIPEDKRPKFKVARNNNAEYRKVFDAIKKPYLKVIRRGKLKDSVANEIACKAMAKAIFLDFKNLEANSEPLDGSDEETRYKVLLHNEELREFIASSSVEFDELVKSEVTDAAGKSPAGSVGGGATVASMKV